LRGEIPPEIKTGISLSDLIGNIPANEHANTTEMAFLEDKKENFISSRS